MLNRLSQILLILGFVVVLGVGAWAVVSNSNAVLEAPAMRLASTPDEFTGKQIRTTGLIVQSPLLATNYGLYDVSVLARDAIPVDEFVKIGVVIDSGSHEDVQSSPYIYNERTQRVELRGDLYELSTATGEIGEGNVFVVDSVVSAPAEQSVIDSIPPERVVIARRDEQQPEPIQITEDDETVDGAIESTASTTPLTQETSIGNDSALAPVIPGWLLFRDEQQGFEIQHPADWQVFSLIVDEAENPGESFLISNEDRTEVVEISVTDLQARVPDGPVGGTPSLHGVEQLSFLEKAFPQGYCEEDGKCGSPILSLWSPLDSDRYISFTLVNDLSVGQTYRQMLDSFRFAE